MEYLVIPPEQAAAPELRADLLEVWVEATDAGGSVGFVPPAPIDLIGRTLDAALDRVGSGLDLLGVLHDGSTHVGMGLLVANQRSLGAHWRTVLRVMVHPRDQGAGAGRLLMGGLRRSGVELGLEHLMLTVRGGSGLEDFYGGLGYEVVGAHPRAVRVARGDDRDEIMMVTVLS